jgi:hypothetical protein
MRWVGLALGLIGTFGAVRYTAMRERPPVVDTSTDEWRRRTAALERARVFLEDAAIDAHDTVEPFPESQPLHCTYVPKPVSGTTPKFDCRLANGDVVKVKYGANPEVPAEVGATRLLRALGFAADRVEHVADLACAGCPPHPFRTRQLAELFFLDGLLNTPNPGHVRTFDHVAVERKFDATPITAGDVSGWQWSDLDLVDPSLGGATRAELDALRLVAVLLAHWDNKASNQRLICLDRARAEPAADGCRRPLLMLQDLGATFGPRKLNHANWSRAPIWESAHECVATMASLPYGGATYVRRPISDEGRLLIARRLAAIPDETLHAIFREAAFPDAVTGRPRATDHTPWVNTLRQKARDIAGHAPCPSSP